MEEQAYAGPGTEDPARRRIVRRDADVRAHAVRDAYRAYETGDRALLERVLADDFVFHSPADPTLYRDSYLERCWPNAQRLTRFEFVRFVDAGESVIVTYECTRIDGSRFRNTEVLTLRGDQIVEVEVYFGWELQGGR
ncbi:MAG TPA: nuclear transport factor 2 family protein [Solirubrobacteraceae bacterium]|jgi:ketosteroid isomerase-like protein|nr:nuclear transport factor 2 family protein [Solirubrobacteraceae bacterium]